MNRRMVVILAVLVLSAVCLPGCHLVPSEFTVNTNSELGPNTLNRIDDINDTLATGIEIGPETRATIEELNKTIDDGLEFGFTESTLDRIDILLGMVEQGVGIKAGLDAETNQTVNNLIETLDDQPGQWENTMTEIIRTLEGSTSNVAEKMADEVQGLMVEARINTQQLSASMGAEFRCNVDFMSTRAGDTLDQFIGRSLVGRLQEIVTGEEMAEEIEEIPVPMVCQMVPDQISLEKVGEEFVFNTAVVRISGYNFVEENKPTAYVVDESGAPVESVNLYPFLSSPYQIQLNLQDIDFSAVPTRSRVVFDWPNTNSFFALAMVLPSEEPTPTVEVRPELTVNAAAVDVRQGPGQKYYSLGKAALGATYVVTGHNGDQSWWQIDFEGDPGWLPDAVVSRNAEPVGTAASLPLDPPTASFSMDPPTGEAALEVHFFAGSQGDPSSYTWFVTPQGGNTSQMGSGKEITYTFNEQGTYSVRLVVSNQLGEDETEQQIVVEEPELVIVIPPIRVEPILIPTATPAYTRPFKFAAYTWRPPAEWIQTDIPVSQYNCAVSSMAAMHGNIKQGKVGNIMQVEMDDSRSNWRIKGSVMTHKHDDGGQEAWSIGVMCVDKSQSMFIKGIRLWPKSVSNTVYLNPQTYSIPESYTCGIAGFDVTNVQIEDDSIEDFIQVYARRDEDFEWRVVADYHDESGDESWMVQMLCFYNNQEKILKRTLGPFEEGIYNTQIPIAEYACGVSGFHAMNGKLKKGGNEDIIRVLTYHNHNTWWVLADYTSVNPHEKWKVDLTCVDRSVAEIDTYDYLWNWFTHE